MDRQVRIYLQRVRAKTRTHRKGTRLLQKHHRIKVTRNQTAKILKPQPHPRVVHSQENPIRQNKKTRRRQTATVHPKNQLNPKTKRVTQKDQRPPQTKVVRTAKSRQ